MECLDVPVGCQTPDKNFEELRGEGAPGLPHSWEPMQWGPAMPLCGCGLPWWSRNTQLSCLWVCLSQQPPHHLYEHRSCGKRSTHQMWSISCPTLWGHKVRFSVPSPTPGQQCDRVSWSPSPGGSCCGTGRVWWPARNGQAGVWGSQVTVTPPVTATPQAWCADPLWRGRKHPTFVNAFVRKEKLQSEVWQTEHLNCRHTNSHQQFNPFERPRWVTWHQLLSYLLYYGPIFQISHVVVQRMLRICLAVVGKCTLVIFGNYHVKFGC